MGKAKSMSKDTPENVDNQLDNVESVEGGQVPESDADDRVQLPDDHPLVKSLAAQKEQIRVLKERSRKLDEIEREQMSDAEKTEARIRDAEERAEKLEAANNRKDVVIEFGLSAKDADILEGVTDIEAMKRIAARFAEGNEPAKSGPKPHPAQLGDGETPPESDDAVARQFFGF